jgi:hypothetical protein
MMSPANKQSSQQEANKARLETWDDSVFGPLLRLFRAEEEALCSRTSNVAGKAVSHAPLMHAFCEVVMLCHGCVLY